MASMQQNGGKEIKTLKNGLSIVSSTNLYN
jgi:hypothetical protein